MTFRGVFLVALTLAAQRILGLAGIPSWPSHAVLPVVWIVALALRGKEHRWPYEALLLGLAWDLLFEPIVGPGGIAWSAAALTLYGLAAVVADRSPKAWAALGAVGAVVVTLVLRLAVLPLGIEFSVTLRQLVWSALLTGVWCGCVGLVLALDLQKHWQTYRVRKLR
jgi:hypothetical protein